MAGLNEQQRIDRALRSKLRGLCAGARSDATVFAVLTVLLTPLAVALAILTLLFAVAFVDLPVIDRLGYELSFATGVNLTLAFLVASYFLRPKEKYQRQASDQAWLLAAMALFCTILALSYATPFVKTHPGWFWSLYLVLALAMLGCVGHVYEPCDDYYLGWRAGPYLVDDPFTIQDDIDRAHFGLGFAVLLSHLVLESYANIFGSMWLWRGLRESELTVAVELLQGLATPEAPGVMSRLRALNKSRAGEIVRSLVKLELVVIDQGRPRLSRQGREFLGLKTAWYQGNGSVADGLVGRDGRGTV